MEASTPRSTNVNWKGSLLTGRIILTYHSSLYLTSSYRFTLNLTGFGQTFPNGSKTTYAPYLWNKNNFSQGLPVFLDSGSNVNYLSNDVISVIGEDYPGAKQVINEIGLPEWIVPCEAPEGTFDFSFGSTTVKIPYRDMMVGDYSPNKNQTTNECLLGFGLGPQDQGLIPHILGNNFMRGAYLVFDSENSEIWLDEADNCGLDIIPIGKGNVSVPRVPGCKCKAASSATASYAVPAPTLPPLHPHQPRGIAAG